MVLLKFGEMLCMRNLRRPVLLYPAVGLLCTLVLLYPLSLHPASTSVDAGDALQQIWTLRWIQRTLFSATPLLNAPTNYPYTQSLVLYQPLYTAAWLTLPFYWLGLAPLTVYNLALLLSFGLSFVGVALLVDALTGSRAAALSAGVLFAFSTARMAHLPHLNLLSGFCMPLLVLLLVRLARRTPSRRQRWLSGAGLALLLAAQVLADVYHAVFVAVLLAVLLAYAALARMYTRQVWLTIAAALLAALLLIAPIMLPSLRAQHELGLTRSFADHQRYAASLALYGVRDQPGLLWSPQQASATTAPFGVEDMLWPGLITLLLAGASLALGWRKRWYALFVLLSLGVLIWSLGPTLRWQRADAGVPNPLYSLLYAHVPLLEAVRVPTRWALLLQLGLSVLAGYGCAGLLALLRGRRLRYGVALLLLALTLADSWHGPVRGNPSVALEPLPSVYAYLAALPPAPLLEFPLENSDEQLRNRYVYYALFHPQPLLNSASSIVPQKYSELREILRDFPSSSSLKLLHDLGIKYVNVNRWELSNWPAWQAKLAAAPGLRLLRTFDDERHLLYEVLDQPSPPTYATILRAPTPQLLTYSAQPIWTAPPAQLYEADITVPLTISGSSVRTMALTLPTVLLPGLQRYLLPSAELPERIDSLALGAQSLTLLPPPPLSTTTSITAPQVTVALLNPALQAGATLDCVAYARGPVAAEGLVWSLALVDGQWNPVQKRDVFFDGTLPAPSQWHQQDWTPLPCSMAVPLTPPTGTYFLVVSLFDPATQTYVPLHSPDGALAPVWRVPQPIEVQR